MRICDISALNKSKVLKLILYLYLFWTDLIKTFLILEWIKIFLFFPYSFVSNRAWKVPFQNNTNWKFRFPTWLLFGILEYSVTLYTICVHIRVSTRIFPGLGFSPGYPGTGDTTFNFLLCEILNVCPDVLFNNLWC